MWIKGWPKLAEFAQKIADSEGLILDIASGPGGGFVPPVLNLNPEATILMDDIRLGLLQEWQAFFKDKGIPNVSFSVFDAKKMPLRSNSIDIVSDLAGLCNIQGSVVAIREAYRVLKSGGTLFSINAVIQRDDFLRLPEDVRTKWYNFNPPFFDGFSEVFEHVGFEVIGNTFFREREMPQNEGELSREADKYGVRLHAKIYCTEAVK